MNGKFDWALWLHIHAMMDTPHLDPIVENVLVQEEMPVGLESLFIVKKVTACKHKNLKYHYLSTFYFSCKSHMPELFIFQTCTHSKANLKINCITMTLGFT